MISSNHRKLTRGENLAEAVFLSRVKESLDASVEVIDAGTREQLSAARRKAIAGELTVKGTSRRAHASDGRILKRVAAWRETALRYWAPGAAVAAGMFFVVVLVGQQPDGNEPGVEHLASLAEDISAIEWLADAEVEELEHEAAFYAWADATSSLNSPAPAEGNGSQAGAGKVQQESPRKPINEMRDARAG